MSACCLKHAIRARMAQKSKNFCCTRLFSTVKAGSNKITPKFNIDRVREFYQRNVMGKEKYLPIYAAANALGGAAGRELAENGRKPRYRMLLPPPNVTGNLHIGHALTVTIEDVLCRYHRQLGHKVTWYPGFDHAGIATQTVVEKELFRDQRWKRKDMTRDKFLERCEQWKTKRIKEMTEQLLLMGCELDWPRIFYTMDKRFSEAVATAFCQLFEQGLIYRAERLVNWCPILESAVSDQEVEEFNGVRKCTRSGGVIQQLPMKQWFLNCEEMHTDVMEAMRRGVFTIQPEFCASPLLEWLKNKEPWCLSRQLYWGHRVPAYRLEGTDKWVAAMSQKEARQKLGVDDAAPIERDPDVLDTWFSSSLIPLCVAGWPRKEITGEVLELMETGHDIIGFWVARMLAVGKRLTGHFPFTNILLHGMVRDSEGRKMSKSLGNVIDPVDVINGTQAHDMLVRMHKSPMMTKEQRMGAEAYIKKRFPEGIPRLGADALRFAFLRHKVTQRDISLEIAQWAQEGGRFCNKVWNGVRYTQYVLTTYAELIEEGAPNSGEGNSYLGGGEGAKDQETRTSPLPDAGTNPTEKVKLGPAPGQSLLTTTSATALDPSDRQLLERFEDVKRIYHQQMQEHELHLAFNAIYAFFERDLCDIYVESTKSALKRKDLERLAVVTKLLIEVQTEAFHILSVFMPQISYYLLDVLERSATVLDTQKEGETPKELEEESTPTMMPHEASVR